LFKIHSEISFHNLLKIFTVFGRESTYKLQQKGLDDVLSFNPANSGIYVKILCSKNSEM
jgi:hypothetical protein